MLHVLRGRGNWNSVRMCAYVLIVWSRSPWPHDSFTFELWLAVYDRRVEKSLHGAQWFLKKTTCSTCFYASRDDAAVVGYETWHARVHVSFTYSSRALWRLAQWRRRGASKYTKKELSKFLCLSERCGALKSVPKLKMMLQTRVTYERVVAHDNTVWNGNHKTSYLDKNWAQSLTSGFHSCSNMTQLSLFNPKGVWHGLAD